MVDLVPKGSHQLRQYCLDLIGRMAREHLGISLSDIRSNVCFKTFIAFETFDKYIGILVKDKQIRVEGDVVYWIGEQQPLKVQES